MPKTHIICPSCKSSEIIKHGKRKASDRYQCLTCKTWFSIYKEKKTSPTYLLDLYLDGVPLRKSSFENHKSPATLWRSCLKELKLLPPNLEITREYCNRYCGYLVFDGKWVKVKGYKMGRVLLWGIDYLTHDIPHFTFAPSENYQACIKYFKDLKDTGYSLQYLVCDDNEAFKMAARIVYPKVIIQTCLNHYKENIRNSLGVRSTKNEKYINFYIDVEKLFKERMEFVSFTREIAAIYTRYKDDSKCLYWMEDLIQKRKELLAYHQFIGVPNTTNMIESYNSHLQGRLKSIKGFKSFNTAKLWLNGYILRRRLKPFTDCEEPFKELNGKCSLEKTLRRGKELPKLLVS